MSGPEWGHNPANDDALDTFVCERCGSLTAQPALYIRSDAAFVACRWCADREKQNDDSGGAA